MIIRQRLLRYVLTIKKLKNCRAGATFKEILDYWRQDNPQLDIGLRTFQRDIRDIYELFKINIEFNTRTNKYYLEDDNLDQLRSQLIESFSSILLLKHSDRFSKYMHLDDRPSDNTDYLNNLLNAIERGNQITFNYQKFSDHVAGKRKVEPYALKSYKNRWYLLANEIQLTGCQLKHFALPRMSGLDVTVEKFQYPITIDIENLYRHCYGIILPENCQPEKVLLWVEPNHGNYIKEVKLHPTQDTIKDDEEGLVIQLFVYITKDLVRDILTRGNMIKVIEPIRLAAEIKNILKEALEQYSQQK